MAVKRRITSATDPKKGGSKAKAKAPAAKATTRKARAPKAAAAKPATTRKARAPKAAAAKTTRKPKAQSAADKKLTGERAKVMATRRGQAKGKTIQARLKVRLQKYAAGLKAAKKSQAQVRSLLASRQKIARGNLISKQKAAKTNLLAKQKARLATRIARKPVIQGNKIVTPKAKGPTKVALVKATVKPLPRLKAGKQTTAKQQHHKGTAAQKSGAKKAARTKKSGKVTV